MVFWYVGESFEFVDEYYEYWEVLLNKIVDDYLFIRDIKVRVYNVFYMMREWKNVIKVKRCFLKKFSKNII